MTWRLKAGIAEPEPTLIARQRLGKHIPAAMKTHTTIEESVSNQRIGKHNNSGMVGKCVFCSVHAKWLLRRVQLRKVSWVPGEQLVESWALRRWVRRDGSCSRELDWEFQSRWLADDGGVEIVQLRVESPAVKRSLYVCCSTVIFGVCDSVRPL
jgi:hypothetical protein